MPCKFLWVFWPQAFWNYLRFFLELEPNYRSVCKHLTSLFNNKNKNIADLGTFGSRFFAFIYIYVQNFNLAVKKTF